MLGVTQLTYLPFSDVDSNQNATGPTEGTY